MWMKILQKLGSRKFLVTLFGLVTLLADQLFSFEIPQATVDSIITLLLAFLGTQAVVDSVSKFTK